MEPPQAAAGGAADAPPPLSDLPTLPVPAVPYMKPSGSKFTSVTTISFAEAMNARYRSTMEDASVVIDGYGGDGGTGYFGIYDGHGGRNVAEFLRCGAVVAVVVVARGRRISRGHGRRGIAVHTLGPLRA